jgi:glyceraldehyde 3-phosphate dehydrogenase
MSSTRVAINGFGRVGRSVLRIAKIRNHFDIVAINDLASPADLQYAFKYDTVHGIYPGDVELDQREMTVDGDRIPILCERNPAALPWRQLEVDFVIESTGQFRRIAELEKHLEAGAKRVILTVPCKDELDATVVLGVNDDVLTTDARIISNASCTTNCTAPIVKVIHEKFGVVRGFLTTVHAYTSDQRLIDNPHPTDLRRSRNAAMNIVPTTTGAARTLEQVIPEMAGRFEGFAMRVPVADGSVIDLTVEVSRDTSIAEVNEAILQAADSSMAGIIEYSEEPLVSSDIIGNPHSAIFDAPLTQVLRKNLVKVVAWYDNEWGYCARIDDLIVRLQSLETRE